MMIYFMFSVAMSLPLITLCLVCPKGPFQHDVIDKLYGRPVEGAEVAIQIIVEAQYVMRP